MASRLAEMQARFQQRQMQEKEEKLLRLYESQQQRAFDRVSRGSAGSNSSITSTSTTGGKVRQMFDERRQKAGIDKSYPLEPLNQTKPIVLNKSKNLNENAKTIVKTTTQKSVSHVKNGNTLVNKNSYKKTVYNNNGSEETYEEHAFDDDNGAFFQTENEIIALMNNHNLVDSLDDEVLPDFEMDDDDLTVARRRKLTNFGGMPRQNGFAKPTHLISTKVESTAARKVIPAKKVNNKPIVRKTVVRAVAPPKRQSPTGVSSTHSQPGRTLNLPPSPVKITSNSVHANRHMPVENKKVASAARAPSTQRPSAKQSAKSAVTRDDLEACRYCSRRFQPDRLQVHEDICAKTGKKKRKTYDATRHRLAGTDLEQFARKGPRSQSSKSKTGVKKTDWRRKHEEFISAIRAAKTAQQHVAKGGKLSDLPPPPPSSNPDYVQCPHCGRRFNETAAERHIPKCATYEHNKPKMGAIQKKAASGRAFK